MTTEIVLTDDYQEVSSGTYPFYIQTIVGKAKFTISDVEPTTEENYIRKLSGEILSSTEVSGKVWAKKLEVRNTIISVTEFSGASLNAVNPNANALGLDAWDRNKVVLDKSLLHGMFTFNVPQDKWRELLDDVEQFNFPNSSSLNGKMILQSTSVQGEKVGLCTYRHPRYQPNRGHLYSSSCFFPSKNALGSRKIGFFTRDSGAYFELDNGLLYAVVRTTIDGNTTEDRTQITTINGTDLEKGNIFDIQMQWRGVGNYKFFINLEEVATKEYLGTLDNLSMYNPANPIGFECINQGDQVSIECGCVDISSEGGDLDGGAYGSISTDNDTGQVAITGFNIPIVAIRSKTLAGALINTRDTLALLATAYGDQKCVFRVWATRDFTAITENDQAWQDFRDGLLEYIIYDVPDVGAPMTFDTAKADKIFGARVDQDQSYATSALFEGRTDIYLTPGDMFVFTMHRENGIAANVGVTFEFSEEI